MYPYKTKAKIHSLNGNYAEVEVIDKQESYYLVRYNGLLCTAIYNIFTGCLYVDDKYGIIRED